MWFHRVLPTTQYECNNNNAMAQKVTLFPSPSIAGESHENDKSRKFHRDFVLAESNNIPARISPWSVQSTLRFV